MAFLQKHAPTWAATIIAKSADDRTAAETAVALEYVNYKRVQAADPDLYVVILRRIEAVDRVFDLAGKYHRANAKEQPAARQQLRAALADWATMNIRERQLRVKRLQETLRLAQDRLEADRANPDQMINDRLNRIVKSTSTDDGWPGPGVTPEGGR